MFIDLTIPISPQMSLYPGDEPTKVVMTNQVMQDGFTSHYFSMGTHAGTHIDAPAHMLEAGAGLDSFALDRFIGRGRYVDVAAQGFESVKQLGNVAGQIVIFNTGMHKKFGDPSYFEQYPVMTEALAQYLVEQKVKMVGIDAFSVDSDPDHPIHKLLMANNILIIENLTNVAGLEGKEFRVYALPLKLSTEGAPARVIAEVA